MIPVDQIRTGDPQGQRTEASVASILEVPLASIPDLYGCQSRGEPRPPRLWYRMLGFIVSTGHQFVRFTIDETPLDTLDLDALGLTPEARDLFRGYHLLGGENLDGVGR